MPVCHPWPGYHFFSAAGHRAAGDGGARAEGPVSRAAGECGLRGPHRDHAAGVSRLPHSSGQGPPETGSEGVGAPLQPGPPACPPGAGDPRSARRPASAPDHRSSTSVALLRRSAADSGWLASRIRPGEGGGVRAGVSADHRGKSVPPPDSVGRFQARDPRQDSQCSRHKKSGQVTWSAQPGGSPRAHAGVGECFKLTSKVDRR